MLYHIRQDKIETYWEPASPYVEKALKKTGANAEYSLDDIKRSLHEGEMQLWLWVKDDEIQAVGVTEILCYPRCKILSIPFVGSEKMTVEEWFNGSVEELIEFAKHYGCKGIKGYGRFGWIKKFQKLGNVRSEASFILEI
jgi:hypothetical protein